MKPVCQADAVVIVMRMLCTVLSKPKAFVIAPHLLALFVQAVHPVRHSTLLLFPAVTIRYRCFFLAGMGRLSHGSSIVQPVQYRQLRCAVPGLSQ